MITADIATSLAELLIVLPNRVFMADQVDLLKQTVRQTDKNTWFRLLESADNLVIDPRQGLTKDKYRLTVPVFRIACNLSARGLYSLLSDIGGVNPGGRSKSIAVDVKLCLEIFRRCVELRFFAKRGPSSRRLVCNSETRTIDGLVNRSYRYLSQEAFIDTLLSFVPEKCAGTEFNGAILCDRRLVMLFRLPEPFITLDNGNELFLGCRFIADSSGATPVIGSTILQDSYGVGFAAGKKLVDSRQPDIDEKLMNILGEAISEFHRIRQRKEHATKLLRKPLKLFTQHKRINKHKINQLARRISGASIVGRNFWKWVIRQTLYAGGHGEVPKSITVSELGSRTVGDLLVRAMSSSARLHYRPQESVARRAFELLLKETQSD